MSEAWRTMQQGYREVDKLYKDTYPPVFARQDWKGAAFAQRTLGENTQVDVWYLAEHFLLAWSDWWGLCHRYLRYFGQTDEALPRRWWGLEARCRSLTDRILQDHVLEQLVVMNWTRPPAYRGLLGEPEASPRLVYHQFVTNHRRLHLFETLGILDGTIAEDVGREVPKETEWFEAPHVAQRLNAGLLQEWVGLREDIRENTLWHMRHYQRANLLASWLTARDDQEIEPASSALERALLKGTPVSPTIEAFAEQLNIEGRERDLVNRVLHRVQAAVADFGYDNFIEDATSGELLGGDESLVGSGSINVVPGHRKGDCHTTLLAVSKGDKKAIGFPAVMKLVREHLIRCINKTKVVIFLCDHWYPGILDDHLGDLQAHFDRGVRFLFLMAGTPGRALAPVAVDLRSSP